MLKRDVQIFLYHHVGFPSQTTRIRGLYVTPRQLDWQLRQLKNTGARFLTFADLDRLIHSPELWQEVEANVPLVIITFDDGTLGVYEEAFPLLQKYQIPAVVYPVAHDLGKRSVVWPDSRDKTPQTILSASQIHEMAQYNIEFGSHLCRHVHADRLTEDELKEELLESKHLLENILNREILSVAYPFGSYNETVLTIASQVGYRFGVTTKQGSNVNKHLMELCRIPVKGSRWHHPLVFWKNVMYPLKKHRV